MSIDKIPKAKPVGSGNTFEQKTPGEWAKSLKTKPHYLSGAMAFAGWKGDQKISQSEYERKLSEWLNRPIGGRR
jgi:hypothetical protein